MTFFLAWHGHCDSSGELEENFESNEYAKHL